MSRGTTATPCASNACSSEGSGFVDLSHRPVVQVTGDDRLALAAHAHVAARRGASGGQWTQALVLSPNGHVEHHLTLVDDGERTLAHVEPGTADALVEYLDSMKFWSKVDVSVREDLGVVWRPGRARHGR